MEYFNIFTSFLIFDVLLYAQSKHFKRFEGSSFKFKIVLATSAALWSLIGLLLLVYFGYLTVWYYPVILFFASKLPASLISVIVERDTITISLIGFIALPFSAYFIYWNMIRM